MTILTQKELDEILEYLNKSITNLAVNSIEISEFQSGSQDFENFISSQFDIRLENLLKSKDSSIHHLESGMKNMVIQKKEELLDNINNQLKD